MSNSGWDAVDWSRAQFALTALYHWIFVPLTLGLSSSRFTLIVMSYVSLMIPLVIAYIAWAWKSLDKHKFTEEKMEKEEVKY